ncbi:membrane-spanning 4-domains subfamily A member 7-like isoform 1-T1 [Molossus nigricans]
MLPQPKAREAVDSTPKDIIIPQREKPGYIDQEEDELQNDIQEEATVLGSIHILCCLVISSFGAILDFSPYSSHLKPAVSTMLMTGYPFVGALCFAITGILSIISGKKSTKPFAMSSTTSSAVSSVVAGAGLFLLTYSLGTLSQLCDSEKEHGSSVPHSGNHDLRHETKNCVPDCVSLMPSLFWFAGCAGGDASLLCAGVLTSCIRVRLLVETGLLQQPGEFIFLASVSGSYQTCQSLLQGHG